MCGGTGETPVPPSNQDHSQEISQNVAFFGKKKGDEGGEEGQQPQKGRSAYTIDEEKANRFFEHARSMQERTSYEYAMVLWLKGLRMDPTSMTGLESFCEASLLFRNQNPKAKGPTKQQSKEFSGKGPLERYLAGLLEWGAKGFEWQAGLRAMEAAVKLELDEPAYFIGCRVLALTANDPKAKKEHYVRLMELFASCGGHDKATEAGERAIRLDPSDGKLEAQVKNMSAMATMARSGFDKTGESGGFRRNIRDSSKQQELEEEERIVKTDVVQDRIVEKAKVDYESRPKDIHAIQKLAKSLVERGKPGDEEQAFKILMKGYKDTDSYRFRQMAGDIKMRAGRRKLNKLRKAAEENPQDEAIQQKYEQAMAKILETEMEEYTDRAKAMPTDSQIKYELGRRHFELGNYDEAIAQFQQAKGAPGIAVKVLNYLGQSFIQMGWLDEAVESFRSGLEKVESETSETGMELRYGLMDALDRKAREHDDLSAAEEAFKIASSIAIEQINFRDIRDRRASLQEFIKGLKAAG